MALGMQMLLKFIVSGKDNMEQKHSPVQQLFVRVLNLRCMGVCRISLRQEMGGKEHREVMKTLKLSGMQCSAHPHSQQASVHKSYN